MVEVRYEVLVGTGISDMKSLCSYTNLDGAVNFYDDLCELINRFVGNHEGSIFRGVFILEEHDDKSKLIKAHYYVNNNGKFSDKEIKYYL